MSNAKDVQKEWMTKKKITIRSIEDGKPVSKLVTVDRFVDLYNTQNHVLTGAVKMSERLVVLLYKETPNHEFFKENPDLEAFAKRTIETKGKEIPLKITPKE